MEEDPILEELYRVREEYAERFKYDLRAMYQDLKARQERGEVTVQGDQAALRPIPDVLSIGGSNEGTGW